MEINQKIYWTTDSYQTGMLWQLLNRLNSTVLRGLIFTTLWHITAAGNNRKLKLIVRYNRRDQRLFTKTNETRCKEIEVWETERWQKKATDREKIACVNLTRLDRFKACWMEITPLEANRLPGFDSKFTHQSTLLSRKSDTSSFWTKWKQNIALSTSYKSSTKTAATSHNPKGAFNGSAGQHLLEHRQRKR